MMELKFQLEKRTKIFCWIQLDWIKNPLYIFFLFFLFHQISGQIVLDDINPLLDKAIANKSKFDVEREINSYKIGQILLNKNYSRSEIDQKISAYLKNKSDKDKLYVYNILNYSLGQANPEYGIYLLNEGLKFSNPKDYKSLADYYGNIGVNYAILGIDDIALKNLLMALDYLNQLEEKDFSESFIYVKKLLLSNITEVYLHQQNLNLAKKYHQECISLTQHLPKGYRSRYSQIIDFTLTAEILHFENKNTDAQKELKKGLLIAKEINRKDKECEILTKLGDFEKDINKKIEYLENSYKISKEYLPETSFYINSSLALIDCYLIVLEKKPVNLDNQYSTNYLVERIGSLLDDTKKVILLINSKKDLAIVYNLTSKFEKRKGNFKVAIELSEKYHRINDSIFSQDIKNKLAALQSANELQLRDKEIEVGKETIRIKEKQTWILISGIFMLILFAVLLFHQYLLIKRKKEELDEANQIKTRFFSILNHDLRSPVGDLIRFLHLKKDYPEIMDQQTSERLDAQTIQSAENLLISMEDLLMWSKGQMENFKPIKKDISVNKLFDEIKLNYSTQERIHFNFIYNENIFIYSDKNYIKTIIRNLTSNAVKALEKKSNATIIWEAKKENGKVILSITDNGLGGTSEQFRALYDDKHVVGIKTGLGLHLVRDMAKAIDCSIKVDSKINKGTTISLIFN